METYVKLDRKEWGALITIDRPKALNALNPEVLEQLKGALEVCENEKKKVVVITGSGNKAFVAGADIASMKDMNPAEAKEFSLLGQGIMNEIASMHAIVIAAVNGYALGGGCELALACDFRIASSNAKFGIPEVSLGVIPGFGGTQRLARIVGTGKAMEMMASAGQISAEEAAKYGLVNEVTEPELLLETVFKKAERIVRNSASAIALGKQSILNGLEMDLQKGLSYEAHLFALTFTDQDQKEGMNAFLEKRKASFS
ncbi:MAG: enoyl-CoA hydratase/isomerase family protein [Eubacterium sp.]|nr:enoyl-CoA hydratase/isomerase family protein [Eubacterium sp.]